MLQILFVSMARFVFNYKSLISIFAIIVFVAVLGIYSERKKKKEDERN